MRQEQHQAGEPPPLLFAPREELVDDDLGRVDEISELRFPENEPVRPLDRIAELEPEHTDLGKRAVDDLDGGLAGRQMLERNMRVAVLHVVEDRVALAKRAARRVLAGEPDPRAFEGGRAERRCFGGGPIERLLAACHLAAEHYAWLDLRMRVKAIGHV